MNTSGDNGSSPTVPDLSSVVKSLPELMAHGRVIPWRHLLRDCDMYISQKLGFLSLTQQASKFRLLWDGNHARIKGVQLFFQLFFTFF